MLTMFPPANRRHIKAKGKPQSNKRRKQGRRVIKLIQDAIDRGVHRPIADPRGRPADSDEWWEWWMDMDQGIDVVLSARAKQHPDGFVPPEGPNAEAQQAARVAQAQNAQKVSAAVVAAYIDARNTETYPFTSAVTKPEALRLAALIDLAESPITEDGSAAHPLHIECGDCHCTGPGTRNTKHDCAVTRTSERIGQLRHVQILVPNEILELYDQPDQVLAALDRDIQYGPALDYLPSSIPLESLSNDVRDKLAYQRCFWSKDQLATERKLVKRWRKHQTIIMLVRAEHVFTNVDAYITSFLDVMFQPRRHIASTIVAQIKGTPDGNRVSHMLCRDKWHGPHVCSHHGLQVYDSREEKKKRVQHNLRTAASQSKRLPTSHYPDTRYANEIFRDPSTLGIHVDKRITSLYAGDVVGFADLPLVYKLRLLTAKFYTADPLHTTLESVTASSLRLWVQT